MEQKLGLEKGAERKTGRRERREGGETGWARKKNHYCLIHNKKILNRENNEFLKVSITEHRLAAPLKT